MTDQRLIAYAICGIGIQYAETAKEPGFIVLWIIALCVVHAKDAIAVAKRWRARKTTKEKELS